MRRASTPRTRQIPGPAVLDLPQTTADLPNDDRRACGPSNKTTLTHALEISCNTAFGWLGLRARRRRAAGPGRQVRLRRRAADADAGHARARSRPTSTRRRLAQSAIGQYDVRVTPLQMAMVAAGDRQRAAWS